MKKNKFNNSFFNNLGIYHKALILILFFIFLLGSLSGVFVYWSSQKTLTELQQNLGISLARDLSTRSQQAFFEEDYYTLNLMVDDVLQAHPEVSYVVIFDYKNDVLAGTFPQGLPRDFRETNPLDPEKQYTTVTLDTEEGLIYDVSYPVFEGRAGVVRLGINRVFVDKALGDLLMNIGIAVLTVCLLGFVAANLMITGFYRDIRNLQGAMSVAAGADFKSRIPVRRRDEIGELAVSFNCMMDKLDEYQQKVNNYQKELEKKEEMQLQLINKLIMSRENERRRISLELYNQIGQLLSSIKLGLKAINDGNNLEENRKVASFLRDVTADTIDKVSAMAVELSPSVLESLGLVPTLEQLMHEKFKDSAVQVHFETEGYEKERFSHSFEITVYRVIEEALNNILNNAQAENVYLSFTLDNGNLTVLVKDDGVGFNVEELFAGDPNNYLGLFGMHEMVTLIGGELSFSSSPGEGTVVQIKLIRNHPSGQGK